MIIGINGKIGSGKDTVGKIIQHLTSDWSDEKFQDTDMLEIRSNFKIKKFAGKLKQTASLLTGIPVEAFEDQEFKKTNLSDEWSSLQQSGRSKVWAHMTVREFLQKLGTEAMRDGLHTNVWVNALFADYRNFHTDKFSVRQGINEPEYPKWIITDMRFPNEMEAVVAKGGITIRVVRPHGYTNPHTGEYKEMPLSYHSSETALDGHTMHYDIINDGTIEDLIEKVKEILIKENII